jgi:hypothetical protein
MQRAAQHLARNKQLMLRTTSAHCLERFFSEAAKASLGSVDAIGA